MVQKRFYTPSFQYLLTVEQLREVFAIFFLNNSTFQEAVCAKYKQTALQEKKEKLPYRNL